MGTFTLTELTEAQQRLQSIEELSATDLSQKSKDTLVEELYDAYAELEETYAQVISLVSKEL